MNARVKFDATYANVVVVDVVFLKSLTNLELNPNFSYISFLWVNFENLVIEFHVPYVLNMYIKFRLNRMLFTFRSINLFFIHKFRS